MMKVAVGERLAGVDSHFLRANGSWMFRAALFLSIFLSGCGVGNVQHASVSARTLARLEEQAVTAGDAEMMLRGDRLATSSTPTTDVLRVPMIRDHAGLPMIEAQLNDYTTEVLFDSGATVTVLDAELALDSETATVPDVKPQMLGVMGNEGGMGGVIERLGIESWNISNLPCIVRLQRSSAGFRFWRSQFAISVLGFDIAHKHCSYLTLDYPKAVFEFGFKKSFSGPTSKHSAKGSFRIQNGVPVARVRSGSVAWDAIVDTGSSFGTEIDQKTAQRLGQGTGGEVVDSDMVMVGVGGAVTPQQAGVRVIKVPELTTLGSTFQDARIDVMPGPARIGGFFLQDYRVTFDFRRRVIWLEW